MKIISQARFFIAWIAIITSISVYADDTSPILNPEKGSDIGLVFEAFLSTQQQGGEESDTPDRTSEEFKSTTPSLTRDQRVANGHRGHGVIRFTKDLSKAYVDIAIEGTKIEEINMFHIHCGKPGILGPILIDFSLITDIHQNFSDDGIFTVELTNDAIAQTAAQGEESIAAAFSRGCFIPSPTLEGLAPVKVSTIAGMAAIAKEGDIYFNLHTTGQTYYGDIAITHRL